MRRRRTFSIVAGGAAIFSLAVLSGNSDVTAAADSETPKAEKSRSIPPGPWKNQDRLLDAADSVRDVMEKKDPSFAGIVIDPDANMFTLYVHGQPNAASSKVLQGQNQKGFRVVVRQAPYSRAGLDQAQDTLWQQRNALGIEAVVAREDGTGLVADVRSSSTKAAVRSADQSLNTVAGVPVTVRQTSWKPTGADGTRQSDTSPYWGGAQIFAGNKACTSSFAVRDAQSTYLVTAGHCFNAGTTVENGSGKPVGKVTFNALTSGKRLDAALIKARAQGYVYDGAYNDGNGYRKPVAGYRRPAVGMYVCQSGAFSGVTCNIKVTYMGKRIRLDEPGRPVAVTDEAEQQNHTAAAGEGDSGGPVFTVSPDDNYTRMTVVGIVGGGDQTTFTTCVGVQERKCAWRINFARFDNLRIQAKITAVLTARS
ncbi:MAG: streptogrisin [Actinomycetota bacterium]|nr:streptogrisin [Actinomycetota bacterium]